MRLLAQPSPIVHCSSKQVVIVVVICKIKWLANDYLEEVRQSVAAMESVQPEAPVAEPAEVVEASASEEPKWNYQVGDTVYTLLSFFVLLVHFRQCVRVVCCDENAT